jgi:rhamnosyltransferase
MSACETAISVNWTQPPLKTPRVAAIVVAFEPDAIKLNRLINTLSLQCSAVFVMDNGGGRASMGLVSANIASVHLQDMRGNRGLGAALNAGVGMAAAEGFDYVTTFDQDSNPDAGQIPALLNAIEELKCRGQRVAAVGPRIIDLRNALPIDYPFMRRRMGWPCRAKCTSNSQHIESDYLITSGLLISMDAFAAVGPFDIGLFVDYTDIEWCFRASARGYRVVGICSVTMSHELSAGNGRTAFGMTILGYSGIRRYYYARNVVLLCRRRHVTLGWKMRLLVGLIGRVVFFPVAFGFSKDAISSWLLLLRGARDGIMGRDGALA